MNVPSYQKVNYLLRLKKQIERKMIIEILQKLNKHSKINLAEYCYFGLGSIYFADFILFHKFLHIDDMISIDDKINDKARFLFNKPYEFIKFDCMNSNALLTQDSYEDLKWSWDKKLIIWLDYDFQLCEDYLDSITKDITTVAKKAKKFDIFITTLECWRGETLKDSIGLKGIKDYLSFTDNFFDNEENYKPDKSPFILKNFIIGCLRSGLGYFRRVDIDFLILFDFAYEDTKLMYTFGCIFAPKEELKNFQKSLEKLQIEKYEEYAIPYNINCPILTPKEKYIIDSCIQKNFKCDSRLEREVGLKKQEIDEYIKFYKYYPQFFEAIY